MKLTISDKKGVNISENMMGLFFEDINYGADGGLYAEMIENRSFEFYDCYGDRGDYYAKSDSGYGWKPTEEHGCGRMEYVTGSPVNRNNPHYLRFTADAAGQGFSNKAYDGICLKKEKEYRVSFYARTAAYDGNLRVIVRKDGHVYGEASVLCVHAPKDSWQKWQRCEATLKAEGAVKGAEFIICLERPGVVEFDFISMMPGDAVAGVFRRDLFEMLKELHPGFLRFPGGCVIEGNTLENRYRWKESVGCIEGRRANYNRWSLHGTNQENGWHTRYSHYNQTLGIGFYEYFLLCEMIGAKPLPVLNVGLACQYQSYELVKTDAPEFREFVQDALDLIEFANGPADTYWGGLRAQMGHPESFGLTMMGLGNEQWETEEVDFYKRYEIFESVIHERYPDMRLIGSAGPDIISDHYREAWRFYREKAAKDPAFCYAIDEHYYVKPEWFYEHTDFYDEYPRDVKVFSGEYAAHPDSGMNNPAANTLQGALSEAAFLTGVERNADVVIMASYAPLLARLGYAQWSPDMIWFDEQNVYGTASYYVQKMYCENMGTVTVPMDGQERELLREKIYANLTLDEPKGEYILKAVNAGREEKQLILCDAAGAPLCGGNILRQILKRGKDAWDAEASGSKEQTAAVPPESTSLQRGSVSCRPEKVNMITENVKFEGVLELPPESFSVIRIPIQQQ